VTFHGARPYDEIAAALRSADAYASLTASDGVSASLLEAMAAGCLPIVSDIPAARTWITPGENGLLVDGSDAGSVAAALRRALQDEALRRLAAERNRAIVERRADLYGNVAAIGRELETLAASHASVVASANAVRRETSASSEKSRPGSDPGRT
jgi:glycosyltransferase involved in cell wall biosynthesis